MIINNFDFIRDKLDFDWKGEYYIIFIILRKKDINEDSPEISKLMIKNYNTHIDMHWHLYADLTISKEEQADDSRVIHKYYIYSKEMYDTYKDEIISMCNTLHCRAYIACQKQCNALTWRSMRFCLQSTVDVEKCEAWPDRLSIFVINPIKTMKLLDLDDEQTRYKNYIINDILKENFMYETRSPHGFHLIYISSDEIERKIKKIFSHKVLHMPVTILYYNDHKDS